MLGKMGLLRFHSREIAREKSILSILQSFQGFQCLRASDAKFKAAVAAALADEVSTFTSTLAGKVLGV